MLRHPSTNFIKYLLTSGHQQAGSDQWINMMITSLGFPGPDQEYLGWLRTDISMKIPPDFQPGNRYHTASRKFMRTEGILGIHSGDKAVVKANLIIINLRIRPLVENLLLGRLDPKDIAKKINAKTGGFHTSDEIEAYQHYYWKVDLLRVEDWAALLEQYEYQKATTMAIVQVGASMALHKMGFQQQIDSKSMLRTMQETIFFDFQEWRTKKHSSDRSKALATLAKAAVMVDTQLSQADSAIKDSLKAFEQFRMETEKQMVTDVHELAPIGNYSGSGAKMIEVSTGSNDEEIS